MPSTVRSSTGTAQSDSQSVHIVHTPLFFTESNVRYGNCGLSDQPDNRLNRPVLPLATSSNR